MHLDDDLRRRLAARLSRFAAYRAPEPQALGRHAAVAVVVLDEGLGADLPGLPRHGRWQDGPALLLTRRAATLRKHAGQWAFPGGQIDPGETAPQAAAREAAEEVGLELPAEATLGLLDDFVTRSGFVITPVVFWAGSCRDLVLSAAEVASAHRIPLRELLRDDAPRLVQEGHSDTPVLRMPVGEGFIAAPTAALIYQFREVCLLGRHTRVGHYAQPQFAWR